MGFVRKWDSSCPRVYDSWHSNGAKWLIQDLPPEDDEKALHLLINYLIPDEPLCSLSKFIDDPESLKCITDIWRECLRQRMTLACYIEEEGEKTLAALNVCIVDDVDERFPTIKVEGEAWKNVFSAMEYVQRKCDPFKYLGCSRILNAFGLVVKKEYRGQKLGSRILSARELLCHPHGIQATSTIFSGPASQISAARCEFKPISEASLKELAENGMKYPLEENRSIKLMVKSFV